MIKDGIIIIDKPQQYTSHDVVNVMRRAVGVKRIGHTGTLDPMATGVLPICIGTATRIMDYLDLDYKVYRCTIQLGVTTDTQDIWGKVVTSGDISGITEEQIKACIMGFTGQLEQIPPKYSALKVNGRKLYEYAREGKEVEIKSRWVNIEYIRIISIDALAGNAVFDVSCSKGTYIRTLCQDIGEKLGCGGTMKELRRIATGIFRIEDAIQIEQIKNMTPDEIEKRLFRTDYPLVHFGRGTVDHYGKKWFINGGDLTPRRIHMICEPEFSKKEFGIDIKQEYRTMLNIYSEDDEFLGTASFNESKGTYVPDKIFYRG